MYTGILCDLNFFFCSDKSLQDILTENAKHTFLPGCFEDNYQLITVRRKHIWEDTKRFFSKPYMNWSRELKVIFVGEPAEDGGGPRREFFRFAVSVATSDSVLFTGPAENRVPVSSTHALIKKEFLYVGNLIAASIAQGGPGPRCFLSWIYDYFCNGLGKCKIDVKDIHCDETRQLMLEMCLFMVCTVHRIIYYCLIIVIFTAPSLWLSAP